MVNGEWGMVNGSKGLMRRGWWICPRAFFLRRIALPLPFLPPLRLGLRPSHLSPASGGEEGGRLYRFHLSLPSPGREVLGRSPELVEGETERRHSVKPTAYRWCSKRSQPHAGDANSLIAYCSFPKGTALIRMMEG